MRHIKIELPDALYADLAELAGGHGTGYGPEKYAADLVCSELASRRLASTPGKANRIMDRLNIGLRCRRVAFNGARRPVVALPKSHSGTA